MNLEINDEERDFLERVCTRAEMFISLNIPSPNKSLAQSEKDRVTINKLILKLRLLDAKLMEKKIKGQ